MGRQVYTPASLAGASGFVEYLFTLRDVNFGVVVPAWLALHRKAATACGSLFGLKYISEGTSAATAQRGIVRRGRCTGLCAAVTRTFTAG